MIGADSCEPRRGVASELIRPWPTVVAVALEVGTVGEWAAVGAASSGCLTVLVAGTSAAADFADPTSPRLNTGIVAAAAITTTAAPAPAMMGHFFLAALVISSTREWRRIPWDSVIGAGGAPFRRGAENRGSSIAGTAAWRCPAMLWEETEAALEDCARSRAAAPPVLP